jgi:hypothetical protein
VTFTQLHKKKSQSVKSGELGGHKTEKPNVIGPMAFDPSLRKHTIQNFANLPMEMSRSPILLEDVSIRILKIINIITVI